MSFSRPQYSDSTKGHDELLSNHNMNHKKLNFVVVCEQKGTFMQLDQPLFFPRFESIIRG